MSGYRLQPMNAVALLQDIRSRRLDLERIATAVNIIRTGLDWEIGAAAGIDDRLQALLRQIREQVSRLERHENGGRQYVDRMVDGERQGAEATKAAKSLIGDAMGFAQRILVPGAAVGTALGTTAAMMISRVRAERITGVIACPPGVFPPHPPFGIPLDKLKNPASFFPPGISGSPVSVIGGGINNIIGKFPGGLPGGFPGIPGWPPVIGLPGFPGVSGIPVVANIFSKGFNAIGENTPLRDGWALIADNMKLPNPLKIYDLRDDPIGFIADEISGMIPPFNYIQAYKNADNLARVAAGNTYELIGTALGRDCPVGRFFAGAAESAQKSTLDQLGEIGNTAVWHVKRFADNNLSGHAAGFVNFTADLAQASGNVVVNTGRAIVEAPGNIVGGIARGVGNLFKKRR